MMTARLKLHSAAIGILTKCKLINADLCPLDGRI